MATVTITRPTTLTTEQVLHHIVHRPINMGDVQVEVAEQLADIPNISSFQFIHGGYKVRIIPHPSREYPQEQYERDIVHPDVISLQQREAFLALPASFLVDEEEEVA